MTHILVCEPGIFIISGAFDGVGVIRGEVTDFLHEFIGKEELTSASIKSQTVNYQMKAGRYKLESASCNEGSIIGNGSIVGGVHLDVEVSRSATVPPWNGRVYCDMAVIVGLPYTSQEALFVSRCIA